MIALSNAIHLYARPDTKEKFLNNSKEPLGTMAICTTSEAAEEYARGDPFVLNGMVSKWYIREWANMFA